MGYIAESELYLTSRAKDLILGGGQHIHPYDLEEAVGALPGVRRGCVAVFAATDPASGTERVVVLAETRLQEPGKRAELRARVADARQLMQAAQGGETLVFFPEGTFSRAPGLKAFHLGAFVTAAQARRRSAGEPARHAVGLARRFVAAPPDLESKERHGFLDTLRSVATEPMCLLLLGGAALYLAIGDLGEGLLLAFLALVMVGLVVFQQRRSERALDALRALAAPHVRVIRDGVIQRIAARELVPGDAFLIGEGERIAADAVLRDCANLMVDESLLTGESAPVRKAAASDLAQAQEDATPGGDDSVFVFASTLAVGGHGVAEVLATGGGTHVGRIGASPAAITMAATPLEMASTMPRLEGGAYRHRDRRAWHGRRSRSGLPPWSQGAASCPGGCGGVVARAATPGSPRRCRRGETARA